MTSLHTLKVNIPSTPCFMMAELASVKHTYTDMQNEDSGPNIPIDTNVDIELLLSQNPDFMEYVKEKNENLAKQKAEIKKPLHLIPTITNRTLSRILLPKPSVCPNRPNTI